MIQADHAGGNKEILNHYSSIKEVYGGKDCAEVTHPMQNHEQFTIGSGIKITALQTPCHTQDSVCYFVEDDSGKRVVFTGYV